jgi:hypothetical protein
MMFVARKIIEQLVEHQKQVAAAPEVAAGKTMPGYGSYVAAMRAQADLSLPDEAGRPSGVDANGKSNA